MGVTDIISDGVIVALDGGGSKTDAVAVDLDGRLVGHARGAASNPQTQGLEPAVRVVDALVTEVAANRPLAGVGVFLAGLDLEVEISTFRAAIDHLAWAHPNAHTVALLDNDMFALLRTGTDAPDAVAVVCGTGINAVGVRSDGATARFPALGAISGDWGGGSQLGEQALWSAARAVDGRGAPTSFTDSVPAHFALPDVRAVTEAFHFGRLPLSALASLAPVVLADADAGDAAAIGILDRQAAEIVALAVASLTRLELLDRPVPVVLGGGVLASGHAGLIAAIESRLADRAPLASVTIVHDRPIVGATLLSLEAAGATPAALDAARASLSQAFGRLDGAISA